MKARVKEQNALAAVYAAHKRYGNRTFPVDLKGKNYPVLIDAQNLGWVWFSDQRHCAITQDGRRALAPYGVEP